MDFQELSAAYPTLPAYESTETKSASTTPNPQDLFLVVFIGNDLNNSTHDNKDPIDGWNSAEVIEISPKGVCLPADQQPTTNFIALRLQHAADAVARNAKPSPKLWGKRAFYVEVKSARIQWRGCSSQGLDLTDLSLEKAQKQLDFMRQRNCGDYIKVVWDYKPTSALE